MALSTNRLAPASAAICEISLLFWFDVIISCMRLPRIDVIARRLATVIKIRPMMSAAPRSGALRKECFIIRLQMGLRELGILNLCSTPF
jgi:hypothetical protein